MSAGEWQIVWFTAWVSALSTVAILPLGLAAAWLLARYDWVGKSVVETIITLPLVMPPVATGLILLKIFGRRGAIGGFLHDTLGLDIVFTWRGVLVSLGVLSFPRALGEFGATIMVAGNIPGKTSTLSLSIFQSVQLGQDATAYRLLAVSVGLAFAAVWGSECLMSHAKRNR